jgi:nucleotide-binding universal stress UspA family protein
VNRLNRVLCPVDFSDHSRRALRHAMAIARRNASRLSVLHVETLTNELTRGDAVLYVPFRASPEDELRAFVDGTKRTDFVDVTTMVRSGDAAESILDQARHDASDLIVMGTHGRSGLARLVLGSVTEQVLRHAGCPVLTIPPSATGRATEDLEPFNPILCASDFSPSSRKALGIALSMAQEGNARLILVHALQVPANDAGLHPLQPIIVDPVDQTEWRRETLAKLEAGLPDAANLRCRPETIVVAGDPSETILRIAAEKHAGLIVMGVQSRGAIDRLLFGSTTRQVIHAARCPVLSIRAEKNDAAWPATPNQQQPVST